MCKATQKTGPQLRLRVVQDGSIMFGPGRADLLELIQAQGSIAAAGREMRMSYKHAWALVEAMNTTFALPLVEAVKGGTGGGGARLTALGADILDAYRRLEHDCRAAAAGPLAQLQSALPVPSNPKSS